MTIKFCPTCREAGKGDDPCVTLLSSCTICSSFTEEQLAKITHRKRYTKESDKNKAEDIDSELLGDNSSEAYGGSQADLEVAANRLFTSPPHPQPLSFEALSLRTPAGTVPPTPGTALQLKEVVIRWQNPANVMKGSDLHPKDHSIQLFTDASNKGWGTHLEQSSTQGLWSPQEKGLHINVLELKAVFLALRHFKDQCQDQTVLLATDNSTVVAYINKQGGTHSAEMCALLWRIMIWCHHSHITLKARHIPGCLNVMADLLSRSNQVQLTEWSLHPQVFKQICQKWFTPTWTYLPLI